jgi:hypothetical protein
MVSHINNSILWALQDLPIAWFLWSTKESQSITLKMMIERHDTTRHTTKRRFLSFGRNQPTSTKDDSNEEALMFGSIGLHVTPQSIAKHQL